MIITDVYAAGEEPIDGISSEALVKGLIDHGHPSVAALPNTDVLAPMVLEQASAGDIVVLLGRGKYHSLGSGVTAQIAFLTGEEIVA